MRITINGITMAYTDAGHGAPIVLVHGFPLSRAVWQPQVDFFQGARRVIAPDLRGLGESPSAGETSTMSQYAEDTHALLRHLGSGPVVLAGHSMGGYVALAFVRQYPDLLRGLVLVSTRPGADSPEAAHGRRATAGKVMVEGSAMVVDSMAPKMLAASNADAGMAARVRQIMLASPPAGVAAALRGMAERPDSTSLLGSIAVPTLVVTGSADTLIPAAESEKMAAAIPGAELAMIAGAGHLVAFEEPRAFNDALMDWLRRKNL